MAFLIGSAVTLVAAPPSSDGTANALATTMVPGFQDPRYVVPDATTGYNPDPSVGGVYSSEDPEVRVRRSRVASKRIAPAKDYNPGPHTWIFERLHVIPPVINVGVVAGINRSDIYVWAPFYYDETLTSLTAEGDANTTLIMDNFSYPQGIKPFAYYHGELTVYPTGEDEINAVFSFNVAGRPVSNLTVLGLRSLFYGFKHNWSDATSETYQWQTSIVTSKTGSEVRASLRNYPRVTYVQNTMVYRDELQAYKSRLFGWFGKNYALPLWQYQTQLLEATEADTFTVKFDNTYMELKPGSRVVVMTNWDDYELMQVVSVVDTETITVFSPINSVWPASSRVVPVVACGMYQPASLENVTDLLTKASGVQFDLSYSDNQIVVPNNSGIIQEYKSEPILPIKPNWADNQLETFSRPLLRKTDYLAGAPLYFDESDFTPQEFVLDMKMLSFSQVLLMREFLYTVEGRLKGFWAPTYQQDFTVTDDIQSTSTTIFVSDNEYKRLIDRNDAKKDLYMELHDGTTYMMRILDVVESSGNKLTVTVDIEFPNLIQPSDIKYLSYLHRLRLNSDTVTLLHTAVGVGEMALPVVTIKAV